MTSTGLAPVAALGPTPMLTQVPQACASVSSYSVGATGRRLQQSSTNNQRITLSSQVVVRFWVHVILDTCIVNLYHRHQIAPHCCTITRAPSTVFQGRTCTFFHALLMS